MANRSNERIEKRDAIAPHQMENQGPIARVVSKTGLGIADTMDKVTATADDERLWFLGGTFLSGVPSGLVWGTIAVAVLSCFFTLPAGLIAGIMLASVAGFSVHDGQTVLEGHQNAHGKSLSDVVARDLGATPKEPKLQITDNAEQTLALAHRPVVSEDRMVTEALDRAGLNEHPGHVARENERRATASAASPSR